MVSSNECPAPTVQGIQLASRCVRTLQALNDSSSCQPQRTGDERTLLEIDRARDRLERDRDHVSGLTL